MVIYTHTETHKVKTIPALLSWPVMNQLPDGGDTVILKDNSPASYNSSEFKDSSVH